MASKNSNGIILPAELGRVINIALMEGNTKELFDALAKYFQQNNLRISKSVLEDYRAKRLID